MNLFSGYYAAPLYHCFMCVFMSKMYSRMHILKVQIKRVQIRIKNYSFVKYLTSWQLYKKKLCMV